MPYIYGYAITDGRSNNNFDHHETSDAKVITGSYRVALPDGRTQIVTYTADDNGYVAEVKYEGEAQYPEHRKFYQSSVTGY
jgi:predicted SAM-dependent methyltransferase